MLCILVGTCETCGQIYIAKAGVMTCCHRPVWKDGCPLHDVIEDLDPRSGAAREGHPYSQTGPQSSYGSI